MTDSVIPVHEVDLGTGISAFFTNAEGGVSKFPYVSLNLGTRVGDDPRLVARNRELVDVSLGVPVRYLSQVHGDHVIDTDEAQLRQKDSNVLELEGDGQVTTRRDIGLGVYVADCVPILLADAVAGIIGTVHAGRPGLEKKVITNTLERMLARGASAPNLSAAVGPCICSNCYEVPSQMAHTFAQTTQTSVKETQWGTPGISLREAAHEELVRFGLKRIEHVAECTYESAARSGAHFSHRFATHQRVSTEGKSGRFAGVVRLDGV